VTFPSWTPDVIRRSLPPRSSALTLKEREEEEEEGEGETAPVCQELWRLKTKVKYLFI